VQGRVEEAERDRDGWRRKVADLARQLDDAKAEGREAEHRLTVANEDLALAEQRLRSAQRVGWKGSPC
jgi:chromosome segregation ATPase